MKVNYFLQQHPLKHLLYLSLAILMGCQNKTDTRSPEKALSTFELPSSFKIELVAAEPLISDPVDMTIDENGQMYVVEMHGYPLDKSGSGKVKLLSDTDGDGAIDKSTVFADSLVLPTGIMRWKQGVLITDAPDVLYLEDTNGDNRADIRKVVLTGFGLSNPQHNFNSPVLGLDNWIYLGNEGTVSTTVYKEKFGDKGSEVFFPNQPGGPRLPVNAAGLNVRFRPDMYKLENLSSSTQFGQSFDTWGRHFQVSNSNHIYQEVIPARYLNRNPNLLISDATQSLSDHGNASEVFPITENPEYQLLTNVGVFTSASGLTAYLGGAFPPEYNKTTFVAEPVSNLVHVDRLKSRGASFTASRLFENKEFLASTDAWFRPVNMYVGPDGALYVVDYYRQIIEHPEWMAEEVVNSGDLYNGTDKGRIYRITASKEKPATTQLEMGDASNEQLVEELANPNIWWRRNAQRLLIDSGKTGVVPLLEHMAQQDTSAVGRLHALWTLEGLGRLATDLIKNAIQDPEPGIRENAVKLAELHLDADSSLVSSLLTMQNDANAKVRYQLLCTLGFFDTPKVNSIREQLLFEDIEDPWVQTAALSAKSSQNNDLLESIIDRYEKDSPAYASFIRRLTAMSIVNKGLLDIQKLLKEATALRAQGWQAPVLGGITEALKSDKVSPATFKEEQQLLVNAFFEHPVNEVREASLNILEIIGLAETAQTKAFMEQAKNIAGDGTASAERKALAIRFLTLSAPARYSNFLQKRIAPDEPPAVQLAALNALNAIPDETVSDYVMEHWPALSPEIRDAALRTFMDNRDRVVLLLDAVESGTIQASAISRGQEISLMAGRWPRDTELMSKEDLELQERARSLLTQEEGKREEVVKKYQPALNLKGNWEQGKTVFKQNCAICHKRGEEIGKNFGPDLASIRNRRAASIMKDILDPQLSIADGYDLWVVELSTGKKVQGVISSETPNSITISNQGGKETIIDRQDIQSLQELGISAMPPGLESQINQQEMADLLAYLKGRLK